MCERCRQSGLQFSRRGLLLGAVSSAGLLLSKTAGAKQAKKPLKPQNVMSPDASLERLMKGNARYVGGTSRRHDFKHEREALVGGQNPYAAMPSLVEGVAPAVKAVLQQGGDTLGLAIRQNVVDTVAKLSSATPILSAAVEQRKIKVVGGVYGLRDGKVKMVA